MELLGIKFALLNVSLERRLETLAAAGWFVMMTGGFLGYVLSIYLICFTSLRWLTILYLIWVYTIDNKTSERGGRRSRWVRNWTWWRYFKNYFPFKAELLPSVQLNPNKNYMFCCFPHGVLGAAFTSAVATDFSNFRHLFPFHTPYAISLKYNFKMPFFRELVLALGMCDSSASSINYLLRKPNGGNIVGIVIGGSSEALNSRPRQYKVVLKNRKGFVKLALKNGSPLVPVITFGEPDLYDQVDNPKGSLLRVVQEVVKEWLRIALVIPIGRGFFQYSFGFIPRRAPLTMLVGRPIEVEKVDQPNQQQIDDLHSKFVEELTELFEDQKHRYIHNAESTRLEIE